jgi:hypothetical protein
MSPLTERVLSLMAISALFFGALDLFLYRDDIVAWLIK